MVVPPFTAAVLQVWVVSCADVAHISETLGKTRLPFSPFMCRSAGSVWGEKNTYNLTAVAYKKKTTFAQIAPQSKSRFFIRLAGRCPVYLLKTFCRWGVLLLVFLIFTAAKLHKIFDMAK
jgi:hypothetical protein